MQYREWSNKNLKYCAKDSRYNQKNLKILLSLCKGFLIVEPETKKINNFTVVMVIVYNFKLDFCMFFTPFQRRIELLLFNIARITPL